MSNIDVASFSETRCAYRVAQNEAVH